MDEVNLVIMNPPFTSWENMEPTYRNTLKRRFESEYGELIYLRPSQQLFFLFLADEFAKDQGGKIASVLPITTFTGKAFQPWVEDFLRRWTVEYVVADLERAAFSEDTDLTEVLIIARRGRPPEDHEFTMVGIQKSPSKLTEDDLQNIKFLADLREETDDPLATIRNFRQRTLHPDNLTIVGAFLRLIPEFDEAYKRTGAIISDSPIETPLFSELEEETDLYLTGGIRTGEKISHYGREAVIAMGSEDRLEKRWERMVIEDDERETVRLRDIVGDAVFDFPSSAVQPAVRRFAKLDSFDIGENPDLCIRDPVSPLPELMERIFGHNKARKYMKRILGGGKWKKRVDESSGRVVLVRRIDLSSPNTSVICLTADEPILPACEAHALKGVSNDISAKLLTLWFNSSLFLSLMIPHSTITRGAYLKFEEFGIEQIPTPDPRDLNPQSETIVEEAFERSRQEEWPSLLTQLRDGSEGRRIVDDAILELMGVESATERLQIASAIRQGLRSAIDALERTMTETS